MTHETTPAGQKPASDGCCGGVAKDKTATPAAVKPDAKPDTDAKHAEHKKAGGSCC